MTVLSSDLFCLFFLVCLACPRPCVPQMMRGGGVGRGYGGRDMQKEMEYGVRGAYDKMSDIGEDLSYGVRRGMDQAKDATYGIGSKMR